MNNHRLSTYKSTSDIFEEIVTDFKFKSVTTYETVGEQNLLLKVENENKILLERINTLLSKPSNFEITSNGKIFIRSEKKFFTGRGNVEIEVFDKEGDLINTFDNMEIAALRSPRLLGS